MTAWLADTAVAVWDTLTSAGEGAINDCAIAERAIEKHPFIYSSLGFFILGFLTKSGLRAIRFCLRLLTGHVAPSQRPIIQDFKVLGNDEFAKWNWSLTSLMRLMDRLDYDLYPGNSKRHEGPNRAWARFYRDHPECWFILSHGEGNVAGWLLFVSLDTHDFERAKSGKLDQFRDSQATGEKN